MRSRLSPDALRWLLGGLITVTVLPVLAVAVVLPFAGKVALAFQHGGDSAALTVNQLIDTGNTARLVSLSKPTAQGQTEQAKVTGGGTISVANPRYLSFGFVAQGPVGVVNGAKGNVNWVNHDAGTHFNGPVDTIISFTLVEPTGGGPTTGSAVFQGHDRKSGCTFTVSVHDNGEPGTDDTFGVAGSGPGTPCGENTGGEKQLSGGNIQIHPTQAH